MGLLADPDNADHRIQHVIHHHAPSGNVAESGVDFLSNVSKSRSGAGIGSSHPPITDRGKQHGHHRDQDRRDHMAVAAVAQHAEHRHGRDWLNHDDAVKDEVPKSESSPQARGRRSASGSGCHVRVLDYATTKLSTIKTIFLKSETRRNHLAEFQTLHASTGCRTYHLKFCRNRRRGCFPRASGSANCRYRRSDCRRPARAHL